MSSNETRDAAAVRNRRSSPSTRQEERGPNRHGGVTIRKREPVTVRKDRIFRAKVPDVMDLCIRVNSAAHVGGLPGLFCIAKCVYFCFMLQGCKNVLFLRGPPPVVYGVARSWFLYE
jgi:hypothetical protein